MFGLDLGTTLGIFGVIVAICLWVYDKIHRDKEHRGSLYRIIWKSAKRLSPHEIMRDRGTKNGNFDPYYLSRPQLEQLRELLEQGKNVLVLGDPLAGKTRLVYESLKALSHTDIIVPHTTDIDINHFAIPRNSNPGAKKFVFFDDLQRFIELSGFKFMFDEFAARQDIPLIATCRSGVEFKRVEMALTSSLKVFDVTIMLPKLSPEQASAVANEIGVTVPSCFDGNVGSLIFGMTEMKKRYLNDLSERSQKLMRCLKMLFFAGIYGENEVFDRQHAAFLMERSFDIRLSSGDWQEIAAELKENSFATRSTHRTIAVDSAYLSDDVINIPPLEQHDVYLDFAQEIGEFFHDNPNALLMIMRKLATISKGQLVDYDISILAIELGARCYEILPEEDCENLYQCAVLLGQLYADLATNRDSAVNYAAALEWFDQAANNVDHDKLDYGYLQMQRGKTHRGLAHTGGAKDSILKAIECFTQAAELIDLTGDDAAKYELIYQHGISYFLLANYGEPQKNFNRQIEILTKLVNESERVKALLPKIMGATYDALGLAHYNKSGTENKEQNLRMAAEYLDKCIDIARGMDDGLELLLQGIKDASMVYADLGESIGDVSFLHKSQEFAHEGLSHVSENQGARFLGEFHTSLARSYVFEGNMSKNPDLVQKALEHGFMAIETHPKDSMPLLWAYNAKTISHLYSDLYGLTAGDDNYLSSIGFLEQSTEVLKELNSAYHLASNYMDLGELLQKRYQHTQSPNVKNLMIMSLRHGADITRSIGASQLEQMLTAEAYELESCHGAVPEEYIERFDIERAFATARDLV